MKKYVFISLLIGALEFALTTQNAFAWSDNSTHPLITEAATEQSILGTSKYLNDNLGFNCGLEQIVISEKSIKKILSDGARTEDTGIYKPGEWSRPCSRGLNHFYDPISKKGLAEWTYIFAPDSLFPIPIPWHWTGIANPDWGTSKEYTTAWSAHYEPNDDEQRSTEKNFYSWPIAREAFYEGLKSNDNTERTKYFARMFRSVGQVSHLLQDMSVPAHVRNDMQGHLFA